MSDKRIYKISFLNNEGDIYEIYAGEVGESDMYGFIEIGDMRFNHRKGIVVDPSEERLASEFAGVKRTYIPMHEVIRIDEVESEGQNKIRQISENDKVMSFPSSEFSRNKPANS